MQRVSRARKIYFSELRSTLRLRNYGISFQAVRRNSKVQIFSLTKRVPVGALFDAQLPAIGRIPRFTLREETIARDRSINILHGNNVDANAEAEGRKVYPVSCPDNP